ncbi:hypothetical protein [Herbaspirillum robiniae]|uniref:DUF2782 domain-containing protein n=1 Tax=Herbaspirillum robiniae TaxID=2014887 RepID=A0A246WLR2_9BURK|nr:hypothetical protein [Herbaspirillum robiniae]NUU03227.1 hypothetical protein [Herbaspirillum robiniae]OWY27264.1 hypothetical protein CEJ42_19590 [Herbaspirillum robiniae]
MKPSKVWSKESLAAALLCLAGLASPLAGAQTPPGIVAQPAPPPPELEKLEEGEPPAVTIRKPGDQGNSGGNSIKEQRDHGQTKEIEVHSGPSTYYMRPNKNLGGSTPGDAQSAPPTSAQWKVGEFDWGVKKKPQQDGDADSGDSKK